MGHLESLISGYGVSPRLILSWVSFIQETFWSQGEWRRGHRKSILSKPGLQTQVCLNQKQAELGACYQALHPTRALHVHPKTLVSVSVSLNSPGLPDLGLFARSERTMIPFWWPLAPSGLQYVHTWFPGTPPGAVT